MRYVIHLLCILLVIPLSADALEITAPAVPPQGNTVMPENTESFGDALLELLQNALLQIRPDLEEACSASIAVFAAILLVSMLNSVTGSVKKITAISGTCMIGTVLILNSRSMIGLASETIYELVSYGKLLFPVMTAAMAAQGGITASAALYAGTAAIDVLLSSLIVKVLVPMVYLYLVLAIGNSATGESLLKRIQDIIKSLISWGLKTLVTIYTTYMSITGVVSGTTDAAALKAAKVTISSFVPVVGGILSDASESILVSAAVMKNAAGIYGILAILALFLEPFLKIAVQDLILKATSALCSVIGTKELTGFVEDFGTAMGLLLAMTGCVCLLLLISVICFLKGVG